MKKIYLIALALLWMAAAFYACKKAGENNSSFDGPGNRSSGINAILDCNVVLSGNITSDMTLSASNVYKLNGCVTVKSGVTLTIPAGTVIQGMKTPTAGGKSFLIIERGGKLDAVGTATSPIIFTSDEAAGSRTAGAWGGLRYFGNANNNNSNSLTTDLGCASYIGGGTNNADNSGRLQYVQIHYAGAAASASDISRSALFLNSVGTGTGIHHVQISNSGSDGLAAFGGKVKLENIASYNAQRMDYQLTYGYQGQMQYVAAMRLDATVVPSVPVYGLNITNQIAAVSSNLPLTQPIISNLTIIGPNYVSSGVSTNYQSAVRFFFNGAGKIYNSVLTSWNGKGLILDGPTPIAQTSSNNLEFSYNSVHNSTVPYSFTSPFNWSTSGGCGASMATWLAGTGSCQETGNEFTVTTLGYNSSFGANFCASGFNQNFTLGSTSMGPAVFTWDTSGAFAHPSYRGAFGSTDWTQGWTNWCPQSVVYC